MNQSPPKSQIPDSSGKRDVRTELSDQFSVFGDLEHVRILDGKSCAFVKYRYRANAEFAR